jgi:hypothetical protein
MKNSDKEKIKSILIAGHKDLALSLLQSQGLSEKASNEFQQSENIVRLPAKKN